MFANFINDIGTAMAIFGGCIGLLIYACLFLAVKVGKQAKKTTKRRGQAGGYAQQAGNGLLAILIRRIFFGRWR